MASVRSSCTSSLCVCFRAQKELQKRQSGTNPSKLTTHSQIDGLAHRQMCAFTKLMHKYTITFTHRIAPKFGGAQFLWIGSPQDFAEIIFVDQEV